MTRKLKTGLKIDYSDRGFTIPIAVGMGLIMVLISATLIFIAQKNRIVASARNRSGESIAVAEAGVARTLVQFTKPENAVLLTRNYDPIDPDTGKNYLGLDGIPNTSDETTTAVNQWNNIPCQMEPPSISYSGTIGTNGQYQLLAYRYDSQSQTGTFLVAGKEVVADRPKLAAFYVAVNISIKSKVKDFPGVISSEPIDPVTMMPEYDSLDLAGRSILGSNGNIYFDAASHNLSRADLNSLDGFAAPGDANRSKYVEAISSVSSDKIFGKIFACRLEPQLSYTPPAGTTILSDNTDPTTGIGIISHRISATVTGGITHYQTSKINISSNNAIEVDTTNGSVYLYVNGPLTMRQNSKIRNIRTDGKPPRVGDLRIIVTRPQSSAESIIISDFACIQTAFVYNPNGDLKLTSSGDGCPSIGNTNIDGVVWAEDIGNTTSSDAGIAVPDDVYSLSDITASFGLPTLNQISTIKSWQRHKL
ncbi:MAG TPA: hypothetical protein DEV81_00980 [Cyanobacteria bacterium UBA11049]|nr:hypothetical protein [Cyanobacteria bacterium UBA11049]